MKVNDGNGLLIVAAMANIDPMEDIFSVDSGLEESQTGNEGESGVVLWQVMAQPTTVFPEISPH